MSHRPTMLFRLVDRQTLTGASLVVTRNAIVRRAGGVRDGAHTSLVVAFVVLAL